MELRLFTTSPPPTPAKLPAPMAPHLRPLLLTSVKDVSTDAKLARLPTPRSVCFANQGYILTIVSVIQLAPTIPLPLVPSVCFSARLATRGRLDRFQLVWFVAPIASIMVLQ